MCGSGGGGGEGGRGGGEGGAIMNQSTHTQISKKILTFTWPVENVL